jgi:hypothetical protein
MKGKNKLNKTSTIYLVIMVLVCLVTLLLCACTGTNKKETTSIKQVTDQVAKNDDSNTGKTEDDQQIVCRTKTTTGSHFKNKVCATKAAWAKKDAEEKEKLDRFGRDVSNKSGQPGSSGTDAMGGMSGGMPR